MVLCDISPLGIAVARASGLPSYLIENFTWDWIYQGYVEVEPGFSKFVPLFDDLFSTADHHIQAQPVCRKSTRVELIAQPVSRKQVVPRKKVRLALGIQDSSPTVLLTMGGIQGKYDFFEHLYSQPQIRFIIPGSSEKMERKENLLLLPHHSGFFHPDLIHASDAVIGKVGYSTVAEVYHAGIPFGCIPRPQFRESDVLLSFIMARNPCLKINPEDFINETWMKQLPELLAMKPVKRKGPNGADQIAAYVYRNIHRRDNSV